MRFMFSRVVAKLVRLRSSSIRLARVNKRLALSTSSGALSSTCCKVEGREGITGRF
jgi:hypothetical protein